MPTNLLDSPLVQYGSLGLSFLLSLAMVRALLMLITQRHETQRNLFSHHCEREKACSEQLMACIDRNTAALEKVEQSLHRIQLELARKDARSAETVYVEYEA
jgi:hypothetical protein